MPKTIVGDVGYVLARSSANLTSAVAGVVDEDLGDGLGLAVGLTVAAPFAIADSLLGAIFG